MANDSKIEVLNVDNMEQEAKQLISARKSFKVCGVAAMAHVVTVLERMIESQNLSCRVYTAKRGAALATGLIPTGLTQLTALGTAIGIAAHNIATWNPDYEIAKHLIDNSVEVIYKKG